jgi:transposase
MRVARPVVLTTEQRDMLESRARARSASARSVERARIVLLAAGGMQDKQIAAKLRIMPEKAARWRNRFLDGGLVALDKDAPRPGRPSTITPAKIQEVVRKTTQEKPSNATHWSTRVMAKAAKLSEKSVRRIWHKARSEAPPITYVQGQQRSPVRRETGSHYWSLSQPARARHRALRR